MTKYFVSYRPHNGERENFTSFDSALSRALFIISLTPRADIVKQWEASGTESEP